MANDEPSDLFVVFIKDKEPVPTPSRTNFDAESSGPVRFLRDVKAGCVFEVDKFSFGVGTVDDENPNNKNDKKKPEDGKKVDNAANRSANSSYKRWRTTGKALGYPVEFQKVSFTRKIDSSSNGMMQNFLDVLYYDRIILFKRKATGSSAAGLAFVRFDFSNALMVSLDWSNDDEIEETCCFICRAVTISYRPQLPDGTLGAIVSAFFSFSDEETQVTL